MKKPLIYVHGGDSFSETVDFLEYLCTAPLRDLPGAVPYVSWKHTLATDLGDGYEIYMPVMPNKHNARYEEWKVWFERYLNIVPEGVILVGHSLGGMFLAKYLSEEVVKKSITALFLLAAPGGDFTAPKSDGDCLDFKFSAKQAENISKQVSIVQVWHSRDDVVVPPKELEWYRDNVPGAQICLFSDKNHFLGPVLPELTAAIKAISG